MRPCVLHLVDGAARLQAAVGRTTAVRSLIVQPGDRPRRGSRTRLVHAHEGTHTAGSRLAGRLRVPLVVTLGTGQDVVPATADLVLAPDDDTAALVGARGADPSRVRVVPSDQFGIAADLEDWYLSLIEGRPPAVRRLGDATPSVTVIMSTYQRAGLLRQALAALERQDYPPERFTLVVVDNGSTDDTPAVLDAARASFGGRLTVLRNRHNTSVAEARNRALTAATGDIVAFTDDDCRPSPSWLRTLVGSFRDDVGIVQGRTRPDPAQPLGPTARSQRTSREHGLYETCNLAYRRCVLEELGPEPFGTDLPERMRQLVGRRIGGMAFGEDVDLAWRAKRRGVGSRFAADAIVDHHVFETDLGYLFRRSLQVAGFPLLVREYPELREHFLYGRYFLSRRHLLAVVALVGLCLPAAARPLSLVPYVVALVRPHRPGRRQRLHAAPLRAVRDIVETGALVYGSVRTRTLVL